MTLPAKTWLNWLRKGALYMWPVANLIIKFLSSYYKPVILKILKLENTQKYKSNSSELYYEREFGGGSKSNKIWKKWFVIS